MKKILALAACALAAFSFAACGGNDGNSGGGAEKPQASSAGGAELSNPWQDCGSLEEASRLAGFGLSVPEAPGGYDQPVFRAVKDEMLEVLYKNGDDQLRLRKAKGSGDISGDYSQYPEAGTVTAQGLEIAVKGSGGKVNVAVWDGGGYAYAITSGSGLEKSAVAAWAQVMNGG